MREKKALKHVKPKEKKKHKWWDSILQGLILALMSLAAVAAGLSIPGLAAGMQDKRVDKFQREVELEPGALSLTSDGTKIEKIMLAKKFVYSSTDDFRSVELENGRFLTEGEAKDRIRDVFEIAKDTGLYVGMSGDWNNIQGKPVLLIPASGDESTGLVWIVSSHFELGDTLCVLQFVVDDSSGLVTALKIQGPIGMMPEDRPETLKKLAENLSAYYAFSDTQLVPQSEEELTSGSSDECFIYFKREGEIILELPVTLGDSMWAIR